MGKKDKARTKTSKEWSAEPEIGLTDSKSKKQGDWRLAVLSRVRAVMRQADPDAVEEVKWKKPSNPAGVPVWSHEGIICTGEMYGDKVKLTFPRGALLPDHSGLFNAGLDGNTRRSIDIRDGDKLDERPFRDLVIAAVEYNISRSKR